MPRPVGRPVIDDEDLDGRMVGAKIGNHAWQIRRFVVGGNDRQHPWLSPTVPGAGPLRERSPLRRTRRPGTPPRRCRAMTSGRGELSHPLCGVGRRLWLHSSRSLSCSIAETSAATSPTGTRPATADAGRPSPHSRNRPSRRPVCPQSMASSGTRPKISSCEGRRRRRRWPGTRNARRLEADRRIRRSVSRPIASTSARASDPGTHVIAGDDEPVPGRSARDSPAKDAKARIKTSTRFRGVSLPR